MLNKISSHLCVSQNIIQLTTFTFMLKKNTYDIGDWITSILFVLNTLISNQQIHGHMFVKYYNVFPRKNHHFAV